jgi:hypothetical protein
MASGAAPNAIDAPPKSPHPTTTHRAINALATPMPERAAALPRHPIPPTTLGTSWVHCLTAVNSYQPNGSCNGCRPMGTSRPCTYTLYCFAQGAPFRASESSGSMTVVSVCKIVITAGGTKPGARKMETSDRPAMPSSARPFACNVLNVASTAGRTNDVVCSATQYANKRRSSTLRYLSDSRSALERSIGCAFPLKPCIARATPRYKNCERATVTKTQPASDRYRLPCWYTRSTRPMTRSPSIRRGVDSHALSAVSKPESIATI